MKVREMIQELERYDPEGRIFIDFPAAKFIGIPSLIGPICHRNDIRITCSPQPYREFKRQDNANTKT